MSEKRRTEPIRRVRNRDIPKLQRVVSLMRDIVTLEERQEWIKDRMTNITQQLSLAPGGGEPKGLDSAYADLDDIEAQHRGKIKSFTRELKTAERILNGITSPTMRTFVELMYILNLPAKKVKSELNMTDWGYKRACRAVENARSMDRVVGSS